MLIIVFVIIYVFMMVIGGVVIGIISHHRSVKRRQQIEVEWREKKRSQTQTFCHKCGALVNSDLPFCQNCGKRISVLDHIIKKND